MIDEATRYWPHGRIKLRGDLEVSALQPSLEKAIISLGKAAAASAHQVEVAMSDPVILDKQAKCNLAILKQIGEAIQALRRSEVA